MNYVSVRSRSRSGARLAPLNVRTASGEPLAFGVAQSIRHGEPATWTRRVKGWLTCYLLFACCASRLIAADSLFLNTDYQNYWFTNQPTGVFSNYFSDNLTNVSTAVYGGHVLGNTSPVLPKGGGYGLEWSSFGQPVEGIQSDVAFGDAILPPVGASNGPPINFEAVKVGDNAAAYYRCLDPTNGAFWVPSSGQIIAAQPNNITIKWGMTNGSTLTQLINVSAVPTKRPARLFWTESPYDSPTVNLSGLFPVIHYNSEVTPPTNTVTISTNGGIVTYTTNITSGVWLDDQKQLHAKGVYGMFIVEYYQEGSYKESVQPDGLEIVQVMEPDLQIVSADVGTRLIPVDTYWAKESGGISGLLPNVTQGLNDTAYVYSQTGPKDNWAFAIKRTWSEPWTLEIYWQHKGRMGVAWPYEVDWYACDWPRYPQRHVMDDASPTNTAPVLIPAGLSAQLMDDMEPALHASLSASGRSFYTSQPGTCLLKYTTYNDIWFEVVETVSHTDQALFDLDPQTWPIGTELTPGDPEAHALRFDGTNDFVEVCQSYLNRRDSWTVALWFNASILAPCVLYSEGSPACNVAVEIITGGQLKVSTYRQEHSAWSSVVTHDAPVRSNAWQFLAVTYRSGSDTNGTVRILLDDFAWETNNLPWVSGGGLGSTLVGAKWSSDNYPTAFFTGKLDEVRVWNQALTDNEVRSNRWVAWPATSGGLVLNLPFNEGQGVIVRNLAGTYDGTVIGAPSWCYGQLIPIGNYWAEFPGYIHQTEGDRYNVNLYNYPTEAEPDSASYVFGVNSGILEVWWANRSRQLNMPAVHYPSRVVRYTNAWPVAPPQIVIASGLGSEGDSLYSAEQALSFNGTSSNYVTLAYSPELEVGGALTVEAWVNLADPAGSQQIVSWASGSPNAGFLLGVSTNAVEVELWTGSGQEYHLYDTGKVPASAWTHIACTFQAGGTLVTYVNGQQVGATPVGVDALNPAACDLFLGRASWTNAWHTLGEIGEVRIWRVVRSAKEIADSWRSRLTGRESGLVACYPFVSGTNQTVLADAGLFGLNGTITGARWVSPGRPVSVPGPLVLGSPSIYYQNDPTLPGYNPNEEHALIMGGVAYALRNDLNRDGDNLYSEPFVLVDYLDPTTARPAMFAFSVLATNELYTFDRDMVAGNQILPPMPLSAMPLCASTYSDTKPPAWADRKGEWWAVSAGDDGGGADALMRFYYQMQPSFYFPALAASAQPVAGRELPWLPNPVRANSGGTGGPPVVVTYHISWPVNPPTLKLGQTLTVARYGLPDIWSQLSVEVRYDQSKRLSAMESITLFDPVADHGVYVPNAVIQEMVGSQLARQDSSSSLVRFPGLPPSLYPRLYYDPNRGSGGSVGELVLQGERVSTLTGDGYLLLNLLEPFEAAQARTIGNTLTYPNIEDWQKAVGALPTELTLIDPDTPYVNAALGVRLTNGVGYVTIAVNNSTNRLQVPQTLPVSVYVLKVVPELFSGELEVLTPDDALAEQLSLRYSGDLAGKVEEVEFQWRWADPAGGLPPGTNYLDDGNWYIYTDFGDLAAGMNEVSISGSSPFTIADHYFAVHYRPIATNGPSGTNWSAWTVGFAPGWVKRAMTGINPFEQVYNDTVNNAVDTRVTMISQAGGPYEGDVALNLSAASTAGLIPTYQTIFNRAKSLGLALDTPDKNLSQTLLFAASRLHDLYMLLGNEAFADAQDPTVAFPRSLAEDQHGADATSIFPFMNQVPSLLDEELALLRGRDDILEPSTHTSPIYNRLIWNYTHGINGGEPAYAYNYNIRGTASNTVGQITYFDAKRFYPQGHGDAWGHYLSAIGGYYDLLSYTNFGWQTWAEATLLDNATVSTDYVDEQKFAETAAARARTGAEIVKQTFRKFYQEDSTARWPGYTDSNTNRAWGVGDWASRAGQAALYDWAVANSLMLDRLTNMVQVGLSNRPPEGIEQIDRASTPELSEIPCTFQDIQSQVDAANSGLNPLGLARNVVPFDIDPSAIDAGQTHFEQIYDRALQALYNACVAFDHARSATLQLREQSDSTGDLEDTLAANETDYHNRLIEIYGYPYTDDVGSGKTYPKGYDGPDLINWQILDLEDMLVNAPTGQVMQVVMYNLDFIPRNDFTSDNYNDYKNLPNTAYTTRTNFVTNSVYMADNGLKVKPPSWGGRRPAQGELQLALADYVQTWYSLQAKMAEYSQTLAELESDVAHRTDDYNHYPTEWEATHNNAVDKKTISRAVEGLKILKGALDLTAEAIKSTGEAAAEILPEIEVGALAVFPAAGTKTSLPAPVKWGAIITYYLTLLGSEPLEDSIIGSEALQEQRDADLEKLLKDSDYQDLLQWNTADTLVKLKEQYVKQAELLSQTEALAQGYERVQKLLTEGQRMIFERGQVRARAAQRIQSQRYADISFRIFRNDALRRYQTAFDLAARYTHLAAKAYDYETGLLSSDTARTPGSKFLEDVVRARLPGRFYVWLGTPMAGGVSGEPGLADILARMKGDWDVVKGRFGFNNPDTETSRFSLRTELFRITTSTNGDPTWAQALENCRVANLNELPEFVRYCRPYNSNTNIEPGIVIHFSSFVVAGKNFFGHDLAGGDNAYDATHAATKIRSVGVWFTGYNITFNTNAAGAGLGNEPRVYLIPVGEDVMRSPTRGSVTTRAWTVFDQAIPLPYNVGAADVDNPDWIPVINSLREPLAQIRRYASLRAYHDRGQFDEAETHNNARLVGRSVWNSRWLLIIPGRTLLGDPEEGIERFIHGAANSNGVRDGTGIKDIKIFFQTYSISGD